jgi:Peptidase family M23
LRVFSVALINLLFGSASPALAETPRLVLPLLCEVGHTCFIQNYVDAAPSPAARDYQCGTLTYDGHNGTDFRIPTLRAQQAGVSVLAAADGRVTRSRSNVPDISVRISGTAAVRGTECGNGLVIDHGSGWETQYCHMAQGSLTVEPGDAVAAGQPIGRVGLSGLTEYPHLHFTMRHKGQVVDPFAYGAPPGSCRQGASLWDHSLGKALTYQGGAVLNAGFAREPVTMESVEAGDAEQTPGQDAPAIVAFVRAIGLKASDVQHLTIKDPSGAVLAENRSEPLDRAKAQVLFFTGRKRPASGWIRGTYQAAYTVSRDGGTIIDFRFDRHL